MPDEPLIRPASAGPNLVQIASRVLNRPLLLHPTKAEILLHVLEGRIGIGPGSASLAPDANRFLGTGRREDGSRRMNPAVGGIAIITIEGSLVNRGAWIGNDGSGLTSYEGIAAQVRDACGDPQIHTILLDLDSPGGEATGMFALAGLIREAGKTKRVCAFVDDLAASAAYGIASAAAEIVVSPTSMVGSIGVVLTHLDRSAELADKGIKPTLLFAGSHKVDGHPFGPLPDSVRADLQAEVGRFYDLFVGLVAAGRGERLTEDMARATQAQTYLGQDAIDRGLADRMSSLDDLLSELSVKPAAAAASVKKGPRMADEPRRLRQPRSLRRRWTPPSPRQRSRAPPASARGSARSSATPTPKAARPRPAASPSTPT